MADFGEKISKSGLIEFTTGFENKTDKITQAGSFKEGHTNPGLHLVVTMHMFATVCQRVFESCPGVYAKSLMKDLC